MSDDANKADEISPLSTASTAQLMEELGRRSASLVIGMTPLNHPGNSVVAAVGNMYTAQGMLEELRVIASDRLDSIRNLRRSN